MPIRRPAALELARALFGVYLKHGLGTEETLQRVATLICLSVELDEWNAAIEAQHEVEHD